ncbi:putative transcriptional regulator [Pseudomonas sp. TE6288]
MKAISMTDDAIANEIGQRIEAIRLKRNIGQDIVAHEAGISRETYRKLTAGKGTLVNVIAVLRVLGELDRLASLIEDVRTSPVQLAKMQGKQRMRATVTRATPSAPEHGIRTPIGKPTLIGAPKPDKDDSW